MLPTSELTFRPLHIDLEFEAITHAVTVGNKQTIIIDNASGSFKHGKLHAIMGPSGCGKSSLLNVLSGFNPVATGTIGLNGTKCPISKWASLITPVRSYILQDDFLVNELTVREQLTYAVELRVPDEADKEKRKQIVNTLLVKTGLQDCAHRFIGLLSGGQRKRVCVASELVNYPPVLFLDEPTTGLDSTSCYRLVELLKSVAQSGCNVIATIHQPNSRVFAIFDTLMVLYNGGMVAYSGPASALTESMQRLNNIMVSHLENPAEILFEDDNIKRLAKTDPVFRRQVIEDVTDSVAKRKALTHKSWARIEGDTDEIEALYEPTFDRQKYEEKVYQWIHKFFVSFILRQVDEKLTQAQDVTQLCTVALPSTFCRFRAIFRRTLLQTQRDKVFLIGRFAAFVFACSLVGLLFQNIGGDGMTTWGNVTLFFFWMLMYTLGVCICTVMTGQDHLEVLLREHINSWYGLSSFYVTRSIIEMAGSVVLSTAFCFPLWHMTGQQQPHSMAAIFCVALLLVIYCQAIHHFSFILAMFVDKESIAQMPFLVVMIQTLFAGFFIRLKDLPIWITWIQYANVGSWTYCALLKLAFGPLKPGGQPVTIPCKSGNPMCARFRNGYDVLKERGIALDASYWHDIEVVAYFAIGFAACSWALLTVHLRNAKRAIARL